MTGVAQVSNVSPDLSIYLPVLRSPGLCFLSILTSSIENP